MSTRTPDDAAASNDPMTPDPARSHGDAPASPAASGAAPAAAPLEAAPAAAPLEAAPDPFPADGSRLVFVLGAFRSGTTLLRKMLDAHATITSPAETWFLLPLLDLWHGATRNPGDAGYAPAQAAAALRQHADRATFLSCVRSFAATFYASRVARPGDLLVDKTPLYLPIAAQLAECFPAARFIVLARDPRSILWSRRTWRHASQRDPEALLPGVAADVRRLAEAVTRDPGRHVLVHYEQLCLDPEAALTPVLAHVDRAFEPSMVTYGQSAHHEGYGDENTREHDRPHEASLHRWRAPDGLTTDLQARLLEACGEAALATLGLDGLQPEALPGGPDPAARNGTARSLHLGTTSAPSSGLTFGAPASEAVAASASPAPAAHAEASSAVAPASDAPHAHRPRIVALVHEGTNSRDHLDDFVNGFAHAGCDVHRVELAALVRDAGSDAGAPQRLAQRVQTMVRDLRPDLAVGLWGNGVLGLPFAEVDGQPTALLAALQVPVLNFWLDAPQWAYQGSLRERLPDARLAGPGLHHLVNNPATAREMTECLGFGPVIAMPYGIDPTVFRPAPAIEPDFDLVFCLGPGAPKPTPLMQRALDSSDPDHHELRVEAARAIAPRIVELAARFPEAERAQAMHVLEMLVQVQLAARDAPMLVRFEAIRDQDAGAAAIIDRITGDPALCIELGAALRTIEQWERAFVFTWLARRCRAAVFSRPSLDGWDCPAERLGWVDHREQSAAYGRGRVGLNVMRWQDDVGLNPKPLEITGSGVACLCQQRVGLDELFDVGEEVLSFTTAAEAGAQLERLLGDDALRARIAEAGLRRTRRDHTWAARIPRLIERVLGSAAVQRLAPRAPEASSTPSRTPVPNAPAPHATTATSPG